MKLGKVTLSIIPVLGRMQQERSWQVCGQHGTHCEFQANHISRACLKKKNKNMLMSVSSQWDTI